MNLPTQAQVKVVAQHAASFAAGAIAIFGLESKVDPAQMSALINGIGTLSDDVISLIGIIVPMVTAYYAYHATSTKNQTASAIAADPKGVIAAVQALPKAQVTVTDPALASPGVIVDPTAPLTPAQK